MEFNYLDSDIDLFWSQMNCTHMEVTYLASMEHPNGSLAILRILPELFCYSMHSTDFLSWSIPDTFTANNLRLI